MPQMAPMNWIILYFVFFLIMIISFFKIFYLFFYKTDSSFENTQHSYSYHTWKW